MAELDALIADTRAGNWQINVHAIGDKANSQVLDVFAKYLNTGDDSRFRIEHAQHILAPELRRFAGLNVIASMQPIHLSSDRPWAINRLGRERIEEGAYLWQSMLSAGVVVASGTDAPVEPVSPIDNFYAAVTRKQLNGLPESGFEASQKLSREQALQAMTVAGAYAAFEEEVKGSLAPGKYADLVVLSQDIMQVPESQIRGTKVLKTMIGGRWVYEAETAQ
jgi:predicted amidohydrolase YtcJ